MVWAILQYLQIFPIYVCLLRGCKCECDDVNLWSRVTYGLYVFDLFLVEKTLTIMQQCDSE